MDAEIKIFFYYDFLNQSTNNFSNFTDKTIRKIFSKTFPLNSKIQLISYLKPCLN